MSWTEGGTSSDTIPPEIVFTPSPQPSIPLTPLSLGSMYTDDGTPVELSPMDGPNRTWWDLPVPLGFGMNVSGFDIPKHFIPGSSANKDSMGVLNLGAVNFLKDKPNSLEVSHMHEAIDVKPDLAALKQLLTPTDSDSGSPLKSLQEQVNTLEAFVMKANTAGCVKHEILIKSETPGLTNDSETTQVEIPPTQLLASNNPDLIGQLFPPLRFPSDAPISSSPDIVITDMKPARLSVNGKRIGRPPGSVKGPTKICQPINTFTGIHVCEWNGCGKKFTVAGAFYQHASDHVYKTTKETRFCQWAGCTKVKLLAAFYQLNAHIRTHTKEKSYVCSYDECGKGYSRLENLKTHNRKHTGEKPYQCSKCDKKFTNASDRAKHENRTHSTAKPYHCLVPMCNKSYTDPSSLRKHFIKIHDDLQGQFAKYRTATASKRDVKVENQSPSQFPLMANSPFLPFNPMMPRPFPIPQGLQTPVPFLPQPMMPMMPPMLPTPGFPMQQPLFNQALANLLQQNLLQNQKIQLPFPSFPTFALPTPIFPFPSLPKP